MSTWISKLRVTAACLYLRVHPKGSWVFVVSNFASISDEHLDREVNSKIHSLFALAPKYDVDERINQLSRATTSLSKHFPKLELKITGVRLQLLDFRY